MPSTFMNHNLQVWEHETAKNDIFSEKEHSYPHKTSFDLHNS